MFKNLKIGKKLGLGFGLVLGLMAAISIYNYTHLLDIGKQTAVAQDACTSQAFAIEKEVDHLTWMAALSSLFLDDQVKSVTVQTDPHKCGLGKWLYSDQTRQLTSDPEFAAIWNRIEGPHIRLHETAVEIGDTYVCFDMELKSVLAHRWIDHLQWMKGLANANLSKTVFDGQLNPRECAFAKWYYAHDPEAPEFESLLKAWEAPHQRLHESAAKIVAAQKAGDWERATAIYDSETVPALDDLQDKYDATNEWVEAQAERQAKALAIYQTDTRKAVETTQEQLAALTQYYANQSQAARTETVNQIDATIRVMLIILLVAAVIGITASLVIAWSITSPVKTAVRVTEAMNEEFIRMEEVVEAISNNDLTRILPRSEAQKIVVRCNDEIGGLCRTVENTLACKERMASAIR
ncbi:MAG: CZB domain-containing protein, partial [candidate division Zixibacteria bacterium]|nr:CZB domain-containing protein [candidate division Zixibacteria bacterium]